MSMSKVVCGIAIWLVWPNYFCARRLQTPTGFRTVPLTSEDILTEGDLLFARCDNEAMEFRPKPIAISKLEKLSLIHTDVGVNLVGAGTGLRLIDWQCPAIGDICEDIYSFLSPAFQILGGRPPLTDEQISIFWNALDRPNLAHRYDQLRGFFLPGVFLAIALGRRRYWKTLIFVASIAARSR